MDLKNQDKTWKNKKKGKAKQSVIRKYKIVEKSFILSYLKKEKDTQKNSSIIKKIVLKMRQCLRIYCFYPQIRIYAQSIKKSCSYVVLVYIVLKDSMWS